jgi:hypothetical protein
MPNCLFRENISNSFQQENYADVIKQWNEYVRHHLLNQSIYYASIQEVEIDQSFI